MVLIRPTNQQRTVCCWE